MQKIFTINGLAVTVNNGAKIVGPTPPTPPTSTRYLKLKYTEGIDPRTASNVVGTFEQVSSSPNIWIWTYDNATWNTTFYNKNYGSELLEIIECDATGVEYMAFMFEACSKLTTVCDLDLSSVSNIGELFAECSSLTEIPDITVIDTFGAHECTGMFYNCTNVQSGILRMYNKLKNANVMYYHDWTFGNCGKDTVTGAAELAQIPSGWK